MPSKADPCLVCGASPTVWSHVVPRALAHDLRRGERHLVAVARDTRGQRYLQSGIAYHGMLCAEHEAALGTADDYGVALCRTIAAQHPLPGQDVMPVENPRPDLGEAFALACLWRTVNSDHGRRHSLSLGRFDQPISARLFDGQPCDLPVLISRSPVTIAGKPVPMMLLPYRIRFAGLNAWRFIVGMATFYVITDARRAPWPDSVRLDKSVELPCIVTDPLPLADMPAVRSLIRR